MRGEKRQFGAPQAGNLESTRALDKENTMRSLSTRAAGFLILALGLWGGLVPFVGHYFNFALGPDKSWAWTSGRFYLSVLPGAVAAIGGLMLIASGPRSSACARTRPSRGDAPSVRPGQVRRQPQAAADAGRERAERREGLEGDQKARPQP